MALNLSRFESTFRYQSGRVIALGRVMLALLFLVSIWFDQSQPAKFPVQTYAFLTVYVAFALTMAILTWRNWWLDARIAIPAHFLDMGVFTAIVFSTNGYTSPFFLFFLLPLLSAAIRWGWRETALTAAALVLFYLTAGLLVSGSEAFELQRFIVRSGHLLILSSLLIWFGVHQQFTRLSFGAEELDRPLGRSEDPIRQALELAMRAARARSGALLLGAAADSPSAGLCVDRGVGRPVAANVPLVRAAEGKALFDLKKDRSLLRGPDGQYRFMAASSAIDVDALQELGVREGLVSSLQTAAHRGWLVLWDIDDLSVDYLGLGAELGSAAGAVLARDALLAAIEEGAAARTRLSLARDIHDNVVQFLAGSAFRVEAMIRASRSGYPVESDLQELKGLLIEEQGEIRTFVNALRRERGIELGEAVEEFRALAARLGRQWSIDCRLHASGEGALVPIRLQLDVQQLLREAVANAVRHGRASEVDVELGVDEDQLCLRVTDNGTGFLTANGRSHVQPWSLKERVDRAQGSLSLRSEPGSTNILITLPLRGAMT
jgi:signal transduction histidine kinase